MLSPSRLEELHEKLDFIKRREAELWLRLQRETPEERSQTRESLLDLLEAKNHFVTMILEEGRHGKEA